MLFLLIKHLCMLSARFFILSLYLVSHSFGHAEFSGARVIEYFGYEDAIELSNGECTAILTPAVGGKIMSYQLNGKEALEIIPEEAGFHYVPKSGERIFSGAGRFDFGLEQRVSQRAEIWVGAWQGQITGPRQATLTSVRHKGTGIQVVRSFTLAATGTNLTCKQTLINIGKTIKRHNHWSRTFGRGFGIVVIPTSEWSRYENHYVMFEPENRINLVPKNEGIYIKNDFLIVSQAPEHPKLGMDSMEGWFSYLTPNDLLFVKKYPVFPEKNYAERVPMTISIWYVENFRGNFSTAELEPIGPLETIAPGERASFTEEWYLVEHAFPQDKSQVDVQGIVEASKEVMGID
tara:strand:+ start:690 stop:1733 length:1044 start_codon:yes stop_codon:yes gene_type:complete